VKKAFRKFAIASHPDHIRGDEKEKKEASAKFAKIQAAYHVLVEKDRREKQDVDNEREL
jgi:DnaJ-class molecular chaperone